MRGAARRPRLLGDAEEPDGIGTEACGLRRPGNQNWSVERFGREESLTDHAVQDGQKFIPFDGAAIESERGALVNGLLPPSVSLEFGARKWATAGPACELQQLRHQLGRGERRLRTTRKFLKAALGPRNTRDPVGGQFDSGFLAEEFREHPACALKVFATQRAHEGGERQRLLRR